MNEYDPREDSRNYGFSASLKQQGRVACGGLTPVTLESAALTSTLFQCPACKNCLARIKQCFGGLFGCVERLRRASEFRPFHWDCECVFCNHTWVGGAT